MLNQKNCITLVLALIALAAFATMCRKGKESMEEDVMTEMQEYLKIIDTAKKAQAEGNSVAAKTFLDQARRMLNDGLMARVESEVLKLRAEIDGHAEARTANSAIVREMCASVESE